MTPTSTEGRPASMILEPRVPSSPASNRAGRFWVDLLATTGLILLYYRQRLNLIEWVGVGWQRLIGETIPPSSIGIGLVVTLIAAVFLIWRKTLVKDKRFYAPLLITCILIVGDAAFSILENHPAPWLAKLTGGALTACSPTFFAIAATIATELALGRFYYGKWPHLASAYVSGISAGILIKSSDDWPFILCGMISITSKYVLRIGERHLWNPTNFGMTVMLFLAPQHVASLSVQAGNEVWSVAVIWVLGTLILWQLHRLHIPIAFFAAFVPLSYLRTWVTGHSWLSEVAPVTSPMFQLYIFFMITDPKSTTKTKRSQMLVAVCVAIMETVYRLVFRDVHSLYHALFTVGPIANLIEMAYRRNPKIALPASPGFPPANEGR